MCDNTLPFEHAQVRKYSSDIRGSVNHFSSLILSHPYIKVDHKCSNIYGMDHVISTIMLLKQKF